jgi:uncharacterized membrane protein
MRAKRAVTILRPRAELEQIWQTSEHRPELPEEATVRFADAPGDRGTEIHVDLGEASGGKVTEVVGKITGSDPVVETGVVVRSDGSPEGEQAARKLKQRPAQPLDESELEKAGV